MKLWVDDVRPCPDGWFWAKNANHAIEIFSNPPEGGITDASLDHDLGYTDPELWDPSYGRPAPGVAPGYDWEAPTGYDLVKWIVANDAWPTETLAVHSANPVGAKTMRDLIEKHGPYQYREPYKVKCNDIHTAFGARYSK